MIRILTFKNHQLYESTQARVIKDRTIAKAKRIATVILIIINIMFIIFNMII